MLERANPIASKPLETWNEWMNKLNLISCNDCILKPNGLLLLSLRNQMEEEKSHHSSEIEFGFRENFIHSSNDTQLIYLFIFFSLLLLLLFIIIITAVRLPWTNVDILFDLTFVSFYRLWLQKINVTTKTRRPKLKLSWRVDRGWQKKGEIKRITEKLIESESKRK